MKVCVCVWTDTNINTNITFILYHSWIRKTKIQDLHPGKYRQRRSSCEDIYQPLQRGRLVSRLILGHIRSWHLFFFCSLGSVKDVVVKHCKLKRAHVPTLRLRVRVWGLRGTLKHEPWRRPKHLETQRARHKHQELKNDQPANFTVV